MPLAEIIRVFISELITHCGVIQISFIHEKKWHFQERSFVGAVCDHWCGQDCLLTNQYPSPFSFLLIKSNFTLGLPPKIVFIIQFQPVRFKLKSFGGASGKAFEGGWLSRTCFLLLTFSLLPAWRLVTTPGWHQELYCDNQESRLG